MARGASDRKRHAGDYAEIMDKKPKNQYGDGREALLRATVDIVATRGLRGLTFRAVGNAAGVNNALIAHHFGNREGLLIATLQWTTEVAIVESELPSATERFSSFEQALQLTADQFRDFLAFQYEMIIEASRNDRFREPVAELYRAFFTALMPDSASSSDALTRAQFATFDGLILQMISGAISAEQFRESVHAASSWLQHSGTDPNFIKG